MARVLIVGDSQRALGLAGDLLAAGHAVRVVSDAPERCSEIGGLGAECFKGTPTRLGTLRGALEHVTIACWLLADVDDVQLARDLHGSRLEQFLSSAIDSTLRGFLYEVGGSIVPAEALAEGRRIASETAGRNLIPIELLEVDPEDARRWKARAVEAVGALLDGPGLG